MSKAISLVQLRRFIVAHQRFATRARNAGPEAVAAEVRRLSCVQLDSISRVDRAHRLTLSARLGRFDDAEVSTLLEKGRLFEYWAHEACLLAIEDYPLFKRRMARLRERHWWGRKHDHDPKVKARVLGALRERGPLPSRFFEGSGGGGMWNWKPEKRILEDLFAAGELVVAGREGFQRLYALPERVIPRRYLEAKVPSDEAFVRGYLLRAIEGRGALTVAGIAEHCRFRGADRKLSPVIAALLEEGTLRKLEVADGGAPVFVCAGIALDPEPPPGGVLLSPFDNMLWDRAFLTRVFGLRHLIEVYKSGPERRYGYYVLPFLLGDRLVGRADLKADRPAGRLRVLALHLEPKVRRSSALEEGFAKAAARLARAIDLDEVDLDPVQR